MLMCITSLTHIVHRTYTLKKKKIHSTEENNVGQHARTVETKHQPTVNGLILI